MSCERYVSELGAGAGSDGEYTRRGGRGKGGRRGGDVGAGGGKGGREGK